jgi:hypothetical protein
MSRGGGIMKAVIQTGYGTADVPIHRNIYKEERK